MEISNCQVWLGCFVRLQTHCWLMTKWLMIIHKPEMRLPFFGMMFQTNHHLWPTGITMLVWKGYKIDCTCLSNACIYIYLYIWLFTQISGKKDFYCTCKKVHTSMRCKYMYFQKCAWRNMGKTYDHMILKKKHKALSSHLIPLFRSRRFLPMDQSWSVNLYNHQ